MSRYSIASLWERVSGPIVSMVLGAVFLKIAWVTDDAYIIHRSVEQLFAGHGPVFNAGERVQAFTSPLWFWCLALVRAVSHNVFLNSIVLSGLCVVVTIVVLKRVIGCGLAWAFALLLLVASIGFFDFTSSGLEGPLVYLIVALWLDAFFDTVSGDTNARALRRMLVFAGLSLLVRHDLLTLVVVPTVYACRKVRVEPRRLARYALIGLAPFLAWSLFALIYYGTVLPNTAYAKLTTGAPRSDFVAQGFRYLFESLRRDTITVLIPVVALVVAFARRRAQEIALAAAVLCNAAYIVWVGGDFMLSRFLAPAFLVSVVVVARIAGRLGNLLRDRVLIGAQALCVAYLIGFPANPVNSPVPFYSTGPHPSGVAHERGAYVAGTLWHYMNLKDRSVFPDHHWSEEGLELSRSDNCCAFHESLGFYGFWAGTDKYVTDYFALADPLLSHLPVTEGSDWRIGHYRRPLPRGYVESLSAGENLLSDPDLHAFYDKVRLITRSDKLLSGDRIAAIIGMNLGRYDAYLRNR